MPNVTYITNRVHVSSHYVYKGPLCPKIKLTTVNLMPKTLPRLYTRMADEKLLSQVRDAIRASGYRQEDWVRDAILLKLGSKMANGPLHGLGPADRKRVMEFVSILKSATGRQKAALQTIMRLFRQMVIQRTDAGYPDAR